MRGSARADGIVYRFFGEANSVPRRYGEERMTRMITRVKAMSLYVAISLLLSMVIVPVLGTQTASARRARTPQGTVYVADYRYERDQRFRTRIERQRHTRARHPRC